MAMRVCPKCQRDRLVNNGSAAGKPKKLCQLCGYQFTQTTPRGKPLTTKVSAVLFYLSGLSMNRIAFLLRVSAQSVLNWLWAFAKPHDEQPKPGATPSSWNGMRCGTLSSTSGGSCGSGTRWIVIPGSSWTGNADVVTGQP